MKDQIAVVHPGVRLHFTRVIKGRLRGISQDMTVDQKTLCFNDFVEALDRFEPTFAVTETTLWQAMEASRYVLFNRSYGVADVNAAVKLLVLKEIADNPEQLERKVWAVKTSPHYDGTSHLSTRFECIENNGTETIPAPTSPPVVLPPSVQAAMDKLAATTEAILKRRGLPPLLPLPPLPTGPLPKINSVMPPPALPTARTVVKAAPASGVPVPGVRTVTAPPLGSHLAPAVNSPTVAVATTSLMNAAEVLAANAERQKEVALRRSHQLQVQQLEERNRELQAELQASKRDRQSEEQELDDVGDISDEDDWDSAHILSVQKEINYWHDKQSRANHTACVPGEPALDRFKYDLLIKHLKTYYNREGRKEKGELSPHPEQNEHLFNQVVLSCGQCQRMHQDRTAERRKRAQADLDQAQVDKEWTQRWKHRIVEPEYESDGGHVGDTVCNVCKLPGGRKGRMGTQSPSRDPKDRDELRNCEGPNCHKSFHCDCRSLEQDTPDNRLHHGFDPNVPFTCCRRVEAWLCHHCWKTIGTKQLAYDRKILEADRARLEQGQATKKHSSSSSSSSSVNDLAYLVGARSSNSSSNSSACSPTPDDDEPTNPPKGFFFLELLRSAMKKPLKTSGKKTRFEGVGWGRL